MDNTYKVANIDSDFRYFSFQDVLNLELTDHSQFEQHKLSFYGIMLITDNEGKHNLNFKEYHIKKGTLFLLRRGSIHKFYKSKLQGDIIVFKEDFILNHVNKAHASKSLLLFNETLTASKVDLSVSDYQDITELITILKKEFHHPNDELSPAIYRNIIEIILSKLFRIKVLSNPIFKNNKYADLYLKFYNAVENEYAKSKSVAYYANKLGVSTRTLNNITHSMASTSAKSVINDILIYKSKLLIINTSQSFTEISYALGFTEPTNFFKFFRKHTGLSTSAFKKSRNT